MQFYALALFEIMCRMGFRYNAYYEKHGCDFVNLAILITNHVYLKVPFSLHGHLNDLNIQR